MNKNKEMSNPLSNVGSEALVGFAHEQDNDTSWALIATFDKNKKFLSVNGYGYDKKEDMYRAMNRDFGKKAVQNASKAASRFFETTSDVIEVLDCNHLSLVIQLFNDYVFTNRIRFNF